MLRSHIAWFLPATFSFFGLASCIQSVTAQTTYEFSANYDILANSRPITSDVSAGSLSGESTDAPYGLTQISGSTYSQIDFNTGFFRFNTDPATFGLQDSPVGEIIFFGSDTNNKLFATDDDAGVIDFETLEANASGTFTITGGEGIFTNATGQLALSEVYTLNLDPTVPTNIKASLDGSIQVFPVQAVPEPRNAIVLLGIGAIGTVVLFRRNFQFTSSRRASLTFHGIKYGKGIIVRK